MLGQGFVKNYQALTACRTLLGFFEAGKFLDLTSPRSVHQRTYDRLTSGK
jgi:hypothetical protein